MNSESPTCTTVFMSLFYALLAAGVAPILLRQIHANDVWKALYSGRYLSMYLQFPHHSTFTYSPVNDFLVRNSYNWFGNLTYIGLLQIGGLTGLQVFRIIIATFALILLHAQTKFSGHPLILLILLLFPYGISQKLRLRTALFAVPFTLILLWIWCRFDFESNSKILYAIPVVFLLWSNLHGSYLIGLGLLLLLVCGKSLEIGIKAAINQPVSTPQILRLLLVVALLVGTVIYVKPYPDYKVTQSLGKLPVRLTSVLVTNSNGTGPEQPTETSWYESILSPFRQTLSPRRGFRSSEFKPPLANTQFGFVKANLFLGSILLVMLVVLRLPFSYIPIVIGTILLGLTYLRSMPYIPLVMGFLVCFLWDRQSRPNWCNLPWVRRTTLTLALGVTVMILTVASAGLTNLTNQSAHEFGWGRAERFSDDLPTYVLKHHPERHIANSFNTGSFLIWKWWPYKQVFIDSKSSAYTTEFWRSLNQTGALKLLRYNKIDRFLIEQNNTNIRTLLYNPHWTVEARKDGLLLFSYQNDQPAAK